MVGFTHLDDDHVNGSSEFFHLLHADKYQGKGRVKINELWVPASAILEEGLDDCARVIREEAKYRLEKGKGIRVFSRPVALEAWLKSKNLTLESRANLITDAGQLVPGWTPESDGVEFFVHSPFASRQNDSGVIDRNGDCLVLHGSFLIDGVTTKVFFGGDIPWEPLEELIRVTRYKKREERLESDIVKIPHHSSYRSLNSEKGTEMTKPTENIAYFYENKMDPRVIFVSSSRPVPTDEKDNQPPHKQAVKYYKARRALGDFKITMQHPSESAPEPLVINITGNKGSILQKVVAGASVVTTVSSPRAGGR